MYNKKTEYQCILELLPKLTDDEKLKLLSEIKTSTELNLISSNDFNDICNIIYDFNNIIVQYYRNRNTDFIGDKAFDAMYNIFLILNKLENETNETNKTKQ